MMGEGTAFLAPLTADDTLLILDSGCSIAISPHIHDFIDGTHNTQAHTIKGIGSGLTASGMGIVNWSLTDRSGNTKTLKLTCLHVPDAPC